MHEIGIIEELVEKIKEYEIENNRKAKRVKIGFGRCEELTEENIHFLFKTLCPDILLEIEACDLDGVYLKSIELE